MGKEIFGDELGDVMAELRKIDGALDIRDGHLQKRFAELEASINDILKRQQRPGGEGHGESSERSNAIEFCILKHDIDVPKTDGTTSIYVPSQTAIDTAITATRAIRSLFRHGNLGRLDPTEKKSLTSFSFGSNQFFLPPQMSDRVLSCLADPTDVAGLMGQETASGGSLKFLIDNQRMQDAAWACEAACFANNPQPDLQDGLGELEIKAETIRMVICAGSDLLQDAAFNIEQWLMRKVATAFRNTINRAIMIGTGLGMPLGILNPQAGIPICDVSESTPPSQFTWQDLVMLKMEVPLEWQANGSFFMNQKTLALLLTMSDTSNRPLWGQLPGGLPGFVLAGSPIVVNTWMPDVVPGATPIAFGDWQRTYTVVNRRATTMLTDPFSAGFCTLFKFEARVGGSTTCPNAARLLRIR